VAAFALLAAGLFNSPVAAIDFFTTLDAARAAHPESHLPRVVIFGSQTCGWCRKLAADTLTDALVTESESKFLWVKVDVDDHEELAARYGVRGLPHTAVVDEHGHVMGERPGYMPPREFIDFLMTSLTQPVPGATRILELLAAINGDDVALRRNSAREIVNLVSRIDSTGREQVVEALAESKAAAWAEFVPYLSHPRLGLRATAHGLLTRATRIDLPFDPFASSEERSQQASAWTTRMIEQGATVPPLSLEEPPAESTVWPASPASDSPPPPPLAEPLESVPSSEVSG
jgi:hypothetical protein